MVFWWCKNSRTSDLHKTKSMVVKKTGKAEVHIIDNQSWNSCRKVASDHEFTFSSASKPTEKNHNALWSCTIHGHLLQPKWCLCGPDAQVNTYVFCAELRLEFCWLIIAGLSAIPWKQWDTRPPELYLNPTKVLRRVRTIRLLGF